jgi:hypothetical protein
MSTGLREITQGDIQTALERILAPRLVGLLGSRQPGHCARVTDAEAALAVRLCERVRVTVGSGAQVLVLGTPPAVPAEVAVTSTKLVELRNPDATGELRPPLLVFVPPGTHASAEDSFGVATFEEVPLGDVYAELATLLLAELPPDLRRGIEEILATIDEEKWPLATSYARARFLLTIQLNDNDPEVVGAAFFELGLVPDLTLFADPALLRTRTGQNVRQMQVLARPDRPERQRVVELGLTDVTFRQKLAKLVADTGLDDLRAWARRIVVDRANWPLSFGNWPLRASTETEAIKLTVGELALPRVGDKPEHADHPLLQNLDGQLFLLSGPQGMNQFGVSFEVQSDPRQIPALARFSAQIVSEDSGPTGVVKSVKPATTGRTGYKVTFGKLRGAGLEQGWHFIRLLPQDHDGIALPVVSDDAEPHQPNESERFLVVTQADGDDDLAETLPPDKTEIHAGVTQALRALEFRALADGRDWRAVQCQSVDWKGPQQAARDTLRASFGPHGAADIPLSPVLRDIQRGTLADPGRVGRWTMQVAGGESVAPVPHELDLSSASAGAVTNFRAARAAALRAIRGDDDLIVEGCDLRTLRAASQAYAEAYRELLSWQLRQAERGDETQRAGVLAHLAATLACDTVQVAVTGPDGTSRTVTLTAPTHPLRLLWLTTWAELGHHWLESAGDASRQAVAGAGETLTGITPLGFPFAVPVSGGRLTIAAADITPYWGACLPTDTPDPQDLIAGLRRALRVPERAASVHPIPAPVLADRVERYLRQHPYVSTLVISAVNAGRGDQLADMLVELQRRKQLADVRYDIRLFAMDETAAATGEALARLMRDEWGSAAGAEAFGTRQAYGLIPKLAVAALPLSEFRAVTEERSSHLTFLFDAFSGETFGAAPGGFTPGTLPVHGLVQDIDVRYSEDDEGVRWHKRPRHGRAVSFPGGEEACDLLAVLPATSSAAVAAVATGQVGVGLVPRVTLGLSPADGALLHQAHRSSDWVITVDRTLGMEYFDSPGSMRRPDYVIDFEGSVADGGLGHHLVISSRSVDELSALLAPVIRQHGLAVDGRHVGTFFDQLRLLSGRLAFKLASATATQRTEVLGLALARLYLGYQGAIDSQVIVPLDDHLELYRDARRTAQELGEAVSLKRTDLALWSLDARRRTITCRLVEVKCYSEVRGVSVFEHLKSRIAEQLARSQEVLRERFDPSLGLGDRPDRAVLNAELAGLLRFYLDRAVRHQTMRGDAADEASWLLGNLDGGPYRLQFTKTGLIFDLSGAGESSSADDGIEYHRIGRDLIEELLAAMPTDPLLAAEDAARSLSSLDVSLPRLVDPAFRAPTRSHETPEELETASPDSSLDDLDVDVAVVGRMEKDAATGTEEVVLELEPRPAVAESTVRDEAVAPAEPSTAVEQVTAESSGAVAEEVRPPQVFLGTSQPSPQYGVLGEDTTFGRTVALDLNETHTISLFGVQGAGKSYTLGSVIEAATMPAPPLNKLPRPLATIVFHYSPTLDYEPEFTSMVEPNTNPSQVHDLVTRYGGAPAALADVVILVPADQLEQRRREHPELTVLPLKFGSGDLGSAHWRFLMGAVGNQSTYIRQLQRIMKAHRRDLRLDVIRDGVADSSLPDHLKQLAQQRLDLAAEYIDDSVSIKDVVRPGRMIIVDLRDEFIEKDEALGLFVVLMQLFADAQRERFNKLVVFDEAHKYIDSPDLVDGLVESVREMRHKGMSVVVASQDPPSVPIKLIELSDIVILHKFNSPAWLRHMQKATVSLADLTPAKMASLAPGEGYVWSSKSTETDFTRGAVRLRLRPRITRHGGSTKTAVE